MKYGETISFFFLEHTALLETIRLLIVALAAAILARSTTGLACKVAAATDRFKLNMHHPIPNANLPRGYYERSRKKRKRSTAATVNGATEITTACCEQAAAD